MLYTPSCMSVTSAEIYRTVIMESTDTVTMEVSYSLVLSLLLSVNLGLSINENCTRELTVSQLYWWNCHVYYLSIYTVVLYSLATWNISIKLMILKLPLKCWWNQPMVCAFLAERNLLVKCWYNWRSEKRIKWMVFVRKENEEEELLFDELNSRKKFRAKIAKETFCLFFV